MGSGADKLAAAAKSTGRVRKSRRTKAEATSSVPVIFERTRLLLRAHAQWSLSPKVAQVMELCEFLDVGPQDRFRTIAVFVCRA